MRKIRRYFRGVAEEAHRVRWPSGRELWPSVAVVIGVTVICAIVLAVSDYLALEIIRAFNQVNPNPPSSTGGGDSSSTAQALIGLFSFIGGKF